MECSFKNPPFGQVHAHPLSSRPVPLYGGHADVAQLVAHHLAKVNVAGSSPVIRSAQVYGLAVEWPRGEARDCKSLYTGSNPVSTSTNEHGRLAQLVSALP